MQSFANGQSAKAGNKCLANGNNVSATSESLANGGAVTANHNSLANGSNVSADYTAAAIGSYVTASDKSLAVGYRSSADNWSMAVGESAYADEASIAGGYWLPYGPTYASAASIAWGGNSFARYYSMAFGGRASAYSGSLAFGEGVVASSTLMALGKWNRTSSNAAFVIGNGTNSSNRSDLMLLDKSGNLYIGGDIYVSGNSPITGGIEYSGVSPVQVDNTNHTIGLELPSWQLCAGPNIEIEEDALTRHLNVSGKDWTDTILSAVSSYSPASYTSPSGTVIVDNDNATVEASTSGLITSSYFAPSATDFGPINISMNEMYGLHKIVDNFISGQVLSSFNHWNITPGGEQDMIMLVMDNDSVVAYSGRPSPPDAYENPWSIPYTANSSGYNLYLSGSSRWSNGISPIKGKSYTAVEVTGYGVVDLYNNYSAGPGISIENHVISAGAGNKVSYWYNTPVTGISAEGDLLISRSVAASTPDKIRVQVGSSDVGLLIPTNTGHNSMLVTNSMGSVQWEAQSAIIPSAVEQAHKVRVYSNDSTYSGENALNDYPSLDHDWEFTIINQYSTSSNWLYYSAGNATATLYPGKGVRVYYCQNTDTLYSEPEFVTDFGDDYATQWGDLGGLKLREVGTSAEASGNGILYVITGGN